MTSCKACKTCKAVICSYNLSHVRSAQRVAHPLAGLRPAGRGSGGIASVGRLGKANNETKRARPNAVSAFSLAFCCGLLESTDDGRAVQRSAVRWPVSGKEQKKNGVNDSLKRVSKLISVYQKGEIKSIRRKIFLGFVWWFGLAEGWGGLLRPPHRCRVPKFKKNRVETYSPKGKRDFLFSDKVAEILRM